MIEWIRYPENQPPSHEYYLVTNGEYFRIADHALRFKKGYGWADAQTNEDLPGVTHYAALERPVEGGKTL